MTPHEKKVDLFLKTDWIYEQHRQTNHKYDDYLPYEFHLKMAEKYAVHFTAKIEDEQFKEDIIMATRGHDLIEDTRKTYNDVKERLGERVADLIYAVTNEKGKNRKERANLKYYEGIAAVPGAFIVKLSDRFANIEHGRNTGSSMYEMYKKEQEHFQRRMVDVHTVYKHTLKLETCLHEIYHDMMDYLDKIFTI